MMLTKLLHSGSGEQNSFGDSLETVNRGGRSFTVAKYAMPPPSEGTSLEDIPRGLSNLYYVNHLGSIK